MDRWRWSGDRSAVTAHRGFLKVLLLLLCIVLFYPTSAGFTQESFYRGKTIRIIVGFSPGAVSDIYSRIYARHLVKHIPENPTIIVENKPGAAGLIAANELFNISRPDGLTIGMVSRLQITAQLMEERDVKFDARKFEWVGAPTKEQNVCVIKKSAGITNIENWASRRTPLKLGAPSQRNSTEFLTALILQDLGIPIRIVSGFKGSSEILLATESGEVDGTCGISRLSTNTTWSRPIAQQEVVVIPLSPKVAKNDSARRSIEFIENLGSTAYSFALPPGTPRERTEILRRAFQNTAKDPEVLAEIIKARLDLNPITGEEVQKDVAQVFEMSNLVLAKLDIKKDIGGGGSSSGGGSASPQPPAPAPPPPAPPPPRRVPPPPPPQPTTSSSKVLPPGQIGNVYWNSWFQRDGAPITQLETGRRYTFALDVSRYQYRAQLSAEADEEFKRKLRESDKREIEFIIRPILVGGTLEFSEQPIFNLRLKVNLDRLRIQQDNEATKNEENLLRDFREGKVLLAAVAEFVQAGKITFDVLARESGCASIAMSVWDESGTIPLDHLIHTVDVRTSGEISQGCAGDDRSVSHLRGGLTTLLDTSLDLASNPAAKADAALHVFELSQGKKERSIAIFIDRTRYEFSPETSRAQERGVFAWELESTLSDYLASPSHLIVKVKDARQKAINGIMDAYSGVAEELKTKLFSSEDKQQDKIAKAALTALQELVKNAIEPPLILARMYSADNEVVYLPLGLLSARGNTPILVKPVTIVQPLPRQRYSSGKTCIAPWTFGIPDNLSGVGDIILSKPNAQMKQLVRTLADLKKYVGQSRPAEESTKSEGFLLLAHHDQGNLWFDSSADRIVREDVKHEFSPGSIAILSACSAANLQGDNRAILEKLNKNGVDALIVSPFPISADYGKQLSLDFMDLIREEKTAGHTPNIVEMFKEATRRTVVHFQAEEEKVKLDEMALEFLIAGDHGLRLCKD